MTGFCCCSRRSRPRAPDLHGSPWPAQVDLGSQYLAAEPAVGEQRRFERWWCHAASPGVHGKADRKAAAVLHRRGDKVREWWTQLHDSATIQTCRDEGTTCTSSTRTATTQLASKGLRQRGFLAARLRTRVMAPAPPGLMGEDQPDGTIGTSTSPVAPRTAGSTLGPVRSGRGSRAVGSRCPRAATTAGGFAPFHGAARETRI